MNKRTYEYLVTHPMLPPGAKHPMMDFTQMEWWMNSMDADGWEFVGFGEKHWVDGTIQCWWIFRRPYAEKKDPRRAG